MKTLMSIWEYFWKSIMTAIVYASGLVISRLLFASLGLSMQRQAGQADESIAGYYLLAGSIVLVLGLLPLARNIGGRILSRWTVLAFFFFISFGLNNPIEANLYAEAAGQLLMIPILLLPCLLCSLFLAFLFASPDDKINLASRAKRYFASLPFMSRLGRFSAASAAFAVIYFLFGLIVYPLVIKYYDGIQELVIPGVGLLFLAQVLRGCLYSLAALPVIMMWSGSRRQLIFALGLAIFILGVIFDVVLAYELPLVPIIIHSAEVAIDSFLFAYILVRLLYPAPEKAVEQA